MKLSIIIPYYNGEQWIAKCLDSLLHQDLASDDYEIIIVDDGSTHGIETLKAYVESHSNIHYLHQENQKHAAARNYGLSIAQGDYIFFCDCDDYVTENVFGRLYEVAVEENADVLLFNVLRPHENETRLSGKLNFDKRATFASGLAYISQPPYQFRGGVWQFLIRRSFMNDKHLRFSAQMIYREEHMFFLQMMLVAGKVVKVDVDVYFYVQHPASWVHSAGITNHTDKFIACMFIFLKFLHQKRLELAAAGSVSEGCLEKMLRSEAKETFSILHRLFRYSTISDNKKGIKELRSLGFYPINSVLLHDDWIRRMMNIYPLWIMLCYCYHLLPVCLRERIVKYIKCKTSTTKHNKFYKRDTLRLSSPFE